MLRALLALAAVLPAPAGRIDVTSESLVRLRSGAELEITIATGGGVSLLGFQVIGPGLDGRIGFLDGSTRPFYAEYLFDVRLDTQPGGGSIPAQRALLAPGSLNRLGSESGVAVLDGFVEVPEGVLDGGSAVLRVRNLGPDVIFGLGDPYSLRNAVTIPGLRNSDGYERSGRVRRIEMAWDEPLEKFSRGAPESEDPVALTPEPSAAGLMAAGLALVALRRLRRVRRA